MADMKYRVFTDITLYVCKSVCVCVTFPVLNGGCRNMVCFARSAVELCGVFGVINKNYNISLDITFLSQHDIFIFISHTF